MNPRDIERDVFEAMACMGWIVPQNDEAVMAAESELARTVLELPESLTDPAAAYDRPIGVDATPARILPFPVDSEIQQSLARAAREGGPISSDVEEAMRRDRRAAECNSADHQDEHDG